MGRCEELQAQHAQMTQSFANAVKECEDAASVAFGDNSTLKILVDILLFFCSTPFQQCAPNALRTHAER
jgi:hypothetical protein